MSSGYIGSFKSANHPHVSVTHAFQIVAMAKKTTENFPLRPPEPPKWPPSGLRFPEHTGPLRVTHVTARLYNPADKADLQQTFVNDGIIPCWQKQGLAPMLTIYRASPRGRRPPVGGSACPAQASGRAPPRTSRPPGAPANPQTNSPQPACSGLPPIFHRTAATFHYEHVQSVSR